MIERMKQFAMLYLPHLIVAAGAILTVGIVYFGWKASVVRNAQLDLRIGKSVV